jgi:dienelactone hydrolase
MALPEPDFQRLDRAGLPWRNDARLLPRPTAFIGDGSRIALRGIVHLRWALLPFSFLSLVAAVVEAQVFDPAKVGSPLSNAPAELYLPIGAQPTGAVVVLHGCNGVGLHDREWARRLAGWGFAALLIDSFGPRGFREVCNRGRLVPPEAQARDAFDGAAYLRTAPEVRTARVGVIGFSHGGWAILKAVLGGGVRQPGEPAFAAAVAYYPGCDPPTSSLETDTLILIGDSDDWTPAARCTRWRDTVQTNGHALRMKIYPGARHAFDAPSLPHPFAGHYIGQDPAAMADSLVETRAFFSERLTLKQQP